jgi:putative photosynthetic complex assembly protein
MSAIDTERFPNGALIAIGALVALSLAATAATRWQAPPAPTPAAQAQALVAVRAIDLKFADAPDGSVRVSDARGDRPIETLAPGTNGFIRGVMRGLAHDRERRGLGAKAPFRLADVGHGRLVLVDLATGRRIDLEAFGVGNRDAFAQLLPAKGAPA